MTTRNFRSASMLVALVLALTLAPGAVAQCGLPTKLAKPSSWNPQMGTAHWMRSAMSDFGDNEGAPTIIGMWHVVFTASSMNGEALPGPTVIDNSMVVWHSDGTEIMNSSRPAQDGNFCLGVWKQTGRFSYYLNHLPWQGNDPSGGAAGIGNPQGGAQLIEQITLSPDGDHYTGWFTLTAYDTSGNVEVSFKGKLSATRVTTSTSITSLL